jgi:hypothetical protein
MAQIGPIKTSDKRSVRALAFFFVFMGLREGFTKRSLGLMQPICA